MPPCKIVYYISGHGFGHAVRSIQIINELLGRGCQVCIKTTAPAFLFKDGLSHSLDVVPEGFDVGLWQLDNIRFDLKKTKEKVKKLLRSAEGLIEKEQRFLLDQGISGIVCDIPFIPLAAAERIGLPAIGISNFSWDWIYSFYGKRDPDWNPLIPMIRRYYQAGGLLLRLPFHGDMEAFSQIEDIPLVARKSPKRKAQIRKTLGLPKDRKIGLIGYSQVDLPERAIKKIEQLSSEYLFLIKPPLNWTSSVFKKVESEAVSFVDLVHAADFVITKPGYGMVSDCLSHGKPMIFSDRGIFPEYPILVEGIKSHLPCCYMPKKDLYSGNWAPYLEHLARQPLLLTRIKTNGAQVAGKRIVEWIGERRLTRI
jgi:hypothetical protein